MNKNIFVIGFRKSIAIANEAQTAAAFETASVEILRSGRMRMGFVIGMEALSRRNGER